MTQPARACMSLLDADSRRARITSFLSSRAADADVFCLQEVQESEFPAFLAALGGEFTGAMSHNDRDWWSNWVVPEIPWAPNGTAIIVRRQAFSDLEFSDIALSGDGDHAELVEGVHRATGRRLRAASIHLDSDVLDFGGLSIPDELTRIESNFRTTGSDHYPVAGAAGF